eukprot:symbB.v1.2.001107.t1/scaffold59.1/size365495/11
MCWWKHPFQKRGASVGKVKDTKKRLKASELLAQAAENAKSDMSKKEEVRKQREARPENTPSFVVIFWNAMGTPWRALTMRLAGDERSFQVLVYDGCCADALQKAVAARVAAPADAIYCTFTPEANGPVLPLSPALVSQVSDSQVLTIHISRPSLLPPVVEPPQATSTSSHLRQSEDALSSTSPMDAVSSPTMQPLRKINSAGVLQNAGNSYASYLRMSRVRWETFTQQTDQLVTAMERFNRLATDLANERTLLAWLRTAMAGIRTIFVFYAMDGVNKFWETSITASEVLMAVLVLSVNDKVAKMTTTRRSTSMVDPKTTTRRSTSMVDGSVRYKSETIEDAVNRPQRAVKIMADFVRAPEEEEQISQWEQVRQKTLKFLNSVYLANFIVLVVFVDAYSTCRDIDSRAEGVKTPQAFSILSDLCLGLYTLELLLHIFLQGFGILRDWMICVDLGIVVCGYLDLLLVTLLGESVLRIGVVRALRLVRIFRLIRLLRKIRTLRELHKLATMMATCAKTLVWSFLLCFLVMTVWSMLMVETVHPLLQQLQQHSGAFNDCKGCDQAMASVMDANLLLFKTVIAGDSWGEIAAHLEAPANPRNSFYFYG